MTWRIVETHPSVFHVQRKWLGFWWNLSTADYETSLHAARMALDNAIRSDEWHPIVHELRE